MSNIKKRNWAFVLYPESAPENWKDLLVQSGVAGCISPLHDKDINPTGECKKEHYHIIVSYDGPTTYNNVKNLTDSLNQPIPQPLETVRGYYRYLTHKDNPEKAQYDENKIINFNGFDYLSVVELTSETVRQLKMEIINFIKDNDICEYSDLLNFILENNLLNYFEVASNNTFFFDKYISSVRNKKNRDIESPKKKSSTFITELNIIRDNIH